MPDSLELTSFLPADGQILTQGFRSEGVGPSKSATLIFKSGVLGGAEAREIWRRRLNIVALRKTPISACFGNKSGSCNQASPIFHQERTMSRSWNIKSLADVHSSRTSADTTPSQIRELRSSEVEG